MPSPSPSLYPSFYPSDTNSWTESILVFPSVTDLQQSITYPQVSIPLYIKEHSIPVRQPKITQVNTLTNVEPSSGFETSIHMFFYGANEPLQVQLSGFLITPLVNGA